MVQDHPEQDCEEDHDLAEPGIPANNEFAGKNGYRAAKEDDHEEDKKMAGFIVSHSSFTLRVVE